MVMEFTFEELQAADERRRREGADGALPDEGRSEPGEEQAPDFAAACRYAESQGAEVEIVGKWPWASFPRRPSEETRAGMKGLGWRWSRKKAAWYIPNGGGRFRRRDVTLAELRMRHGHAAVTAAEAASFFAEEG